LAVKLIIIHRDRVDVRSSYVLLAGPMGCGRFNIAIHQYLLVGDAGVIANALCSER
jgi:hypothetical protein